MFRRLLTLLVVAAGLAVVWPPASPSSADEPDAAVLGPGTQPNVVVFMTDDMAAGDLRWMPRTRRLIGRPGMRFEQGLAPNPLCCPARATFLTGQESHNNDVWGNAGVHGGYGALSTTVTRLPEWLQDAGYRTALIGKHLNGFKARHATAERGWNVLDVLVKGVYDFRRFVSWNNGDRVKVEDGYVTDHLTASTLSTLDRFERRDRHPFFMWVSHVAPHASSVRQCRGCWTFPVPDDRDRGDMDGVPSPSRALPSYNRENGGDRPPFLRGVAPRADSYVDRYFQRRVESLQAVDRSVAQTVRGLRARGELSDTVLMFTSDHGFALGQYRYVGKRLPYEDVLRVPLLVRGPGVGRGTSEQATTTADLTRTIVEVAGATAPYELDGVSMLPALTGVAGETRSATVLQTGASFAEEGDDSGLDGEPSDTGWLYRGYRDDRYTYARYPDPLGDDTAAFEELYDRVRDPHQLHNVARDQAYASVLDQARRRSQELAVCAGATCHPDWQPLPGPD